MTAQEYFYNHWQKTNRSRFGHYGEYDSEDYAIAFANDYAALRIQDVVGRTEQLKALLENLLENNMCSHAGDKLIEEALKGF